MDRHRFAAVVLAACVAAVAAALVACGGSPAPGGSAAGTPVKGGTLVVTYQGEPQGLDPAIDWEGQGWSIEHCLFNTFLKYSSGPGSEGTTLLPHLATELPSEANGGITDAGTTYTFHLRQGVKFAPPVDREVTSEDFKYSFERMMADPKAPATGFYTGIVGASDFMGGKAEHISGFATPDKYTVVIQLEEPDMAFLAAMSMTFTQVVAREWVEKWGREINRHPLGTGPFVLDHWTVGQELVLTRNPNYFAAGEVHLGAIRFEFSFSPSTALLKLQRGEVNVLGDYIPPADYARVTTDPQWKALVAEEPMIAMDYLFMDVHVKPFDDVLVRRAVSLAIDRERIVKLLGGTADPLTQILPAGLPGHQDGAAGDFYPYDPAKAKELLAQADHADGFTTKLYSHNVDPWPKVLQSIQRDLDEVGITAEVQVLDRATYWTLIGKPGACPMGLNDWWMDFPDPSNFIVPLWSRSAAIEEGTNPSFFWDPKVEELLAAARGNTDVADRVEQFVEMQRVIMEQAPGVPLYQPKLNSMHTADVGGFYLHPVWIFSFPDYYFTSKGA